MKSRKLTRLDQFSYRDEDNQAIFTRLPDDGFNHAMELRLTSDGQGAALLFTLEEVRAIQQWLNHYLETFTTGGSATSFRIVQGKDYEGFSIRATNRGEPFRVGIDLSFDVDNDYHGIFIEKHHIQDLNVWLKSE